MFDDLMFGLGLGFQILVMRNGLATDRVGGPTIEQVLLGNTALFHSWASYPTLKYFPTFSRTKENKSHRGTW